MIIPIKMSYKIMIVYLFVGYIVLNIGGTIMNFIDFFVSNQCNENTATNIFDFIVYAIATIVLCCIFRMEKQNILDNSSGKYTKELYFQFCLIVFCYFFWHSIIIIINITTISIGPDKNCDRDIFNIVRIVYDGLVIVYSIISMVFSYLGYRDAAKNNFQLIILND